MLSFPVCFLGQALIHGYACVQMVGQYHLGEFVNKFRHGCLVMKLPDSEAATIPTVLFGTINGTIGVLASLPQEQFKFMERLQVPALSRNTSQHSGA